MPWIDILIIRWLIWRGQPGKAAQHATRTIEAITRSSAVQIAKVAAAAFIDVPRSKETRIIRASGDVFKIGQKVRIDNREFAVTRLLSASKREVIYEVVG